jgi:hypothetical protein
MSPIIAIFDTYVIVTHEWCLFARAGDDFRFVSSRYKLSFWAMTTTHATSVSRTDSYEWGNSGDELSICAFQVDHCLKRYREECALVDAFDTRSQM